MPPSQEIGAVSEGVQAPSRGEDCGIVRRGTETEQTLSLTAIGG